MTEPFSTSQVEELLADLVRLVAERRPAEVEIPASFAADKETTEKQYQQSRQQNTQRYENQKLPAEEEYASARRAILAEFESAQQAAQKEYDGVRKDILARFEGAATAAKQELDEARWQATTVFDATRNGPGLQLQQIQSQLGAQQRKLEAIRRDTELLLKRRWQWRDWDNSEAAPATPEGEPGNRLSEAVSLASQQRRRLSEQAVARLFEGGRPLGVFLLLWLAAVYPAGLLAGWAGWYWIALSAGSALLLYAVIGTWLYRIARRQSGEAYRALRRILFEADQVRPAVLEAVKADCQARYAEIVKRRDEDLQEAAEKFSRASAELNGRKQDESRAADEKYPALLSEIVARRDRELKGLDESHARQLQQIEQRFASESQRLQAEYSQEMAASEGRLQRQWGAMTQQWCNGLQRFQSAVTEINRACDRLFPDWNSADWENWSPATEIPPAIRFGLFQTGLDQLEGGVPEDQRLRPAETEFSPPALLPFPDRSLLLLKAAGEGRAVAIEVIQAVMLRMLTAIPPGKVRFTIIDPVGLGENFSAFMHLADYDDQLVASRIWTDAAHITQRLTDLTEHMENVIQVYLRNEFESIRQYNDFAGEMAEPYRVLVIANFPANFSEAAARRLKSIVASGARCGVFTLLSVDTKLKLPRDFHMADLESHALNLRLSEGRFIWKHPDFGEMPLSFSPPPPAEKLTEVVRAVGRQVQDADRVEVPFECVVPEEPQLWTSDSSGGIDVPLGRAGAMKLQHLSLGKGTAQHVLIAGKTGSGKSTLLHALITNLALRYSPEQVEFYLVDFKKGVEFKAYAAGVLPHARVIAIESEREFGLSVLERLDLELKRRGDLFRKLGVQDLAAFRAAKPEDKLPRVMLIIDEFQELFVDDDRLAQTAALLMDRLVRQGRAFGIHVLLGSQTLAGAYSLARSTIGQMAVRIALQCSEADSHLILSEENTGARLLTRPGEAIYNDANGLYEGNHPFQVVWLPDAQRETYLQQIRRLAEQHRWRGKPPIVFEGNVAADPSENPLLKKLLAAASWPETSPPARAWLGAAVAIKDPTAAAFPRQSGANLLIVGHREEAALGVLATSLISLAAGDTLPQTGAGSPAARFFILDGTRPDAPEAGFFKRLAPVVPQAVRVAAVRETAAVVAELAAEVARRQQTEQEHAPPVYLIIFDLGRFRDLRKAEDDFGLSRSDEDQPPEPAEQFAEILREGPAVGVHALIWCDTYNNVGRALDRQGLREMELRVLFQISGTDSSNLIDSSAAARLGVHRAILYNEGHGRLEKFRPYGPPSAEWLAWVKQQLHARAAIPSTQ